MNRRSLLDRLERLDLLESRLKSDEPLVIGDLASEFGVSLRTLSRDIALLRERGLPIDADRGRGGGVRLNRQWGIGRIQLSHAQAVDLLVSLAAAEQMKSPILMANLAPIRHKLMASFSASNRDKINGLKRRLLIGVSASPEVHASYAAPSPKVVEKLHQAFLMMTRARIAYVDSGGETTQREIEPHYLLLNAPIWYVLAFDHLRKDIRTFRIDRVRAAEGLEQSFPLRPCGEFRDALEGGDILLP